MAHNQHSTMVEAHCIFIVISFDLLYYLYMFGWHTIVVVNVEDIVQINYFTLKSFSLEYQAFIEQLGVGFIMESFFICSIRKQFTTAKPSAAYTMLIVAH